MFVVARSPHLGLASSSIIFALSSGVTENIRAPQQSQVFVSQARSYKGLHTYLVESVTLWASAMRGSEYKKWASVISLLKEDETDQAVEEPDEIMHINRDSESKYDKKVIDMKRLS
ncbi:hypothetical protein TNCV_1018141 [Trichonephila clavipes]|nr:hypothetical protein TNCV_1018141 [Trichonephila clavipes]